MASSNASWDYCVFNDMDGNGIPELILGRPANEERDMVNFLEGDDIQARPCADNISSKYDVYSSLEEAWQAYLASLHY